MSPPISTTPHTLRSNWLALYRHYLALAPYPEKLKTFLGELYRPPACHATAGRNPSTCQTDPGVTLQRMVERMESKMALLEGAFDNQLAKLKEMKLKNSALTTSKQDAVKARRDVMVENQRLRAIQKELEECNVFLMSQVKSLDRVNARRTIDRRNQTMENQTQRIGLQAAEIAELKRINNELEERLANVSKKLESDKKRLRDKVCYYKKKSMASQKPTCSAGMGLEEELDSLRNTNAELRDQMGAIMANSEISSFESGRYTDEVRLVCYELLSCGVGSANLGHVIRTVLKLWQALTLAGFLNQP
ncbi:putative myosin-9-like [Apostichopus japonicus]|uniref:Putative myosin-9-like n=1 Tax=Stichopus japonicus TaxID=307972 RepID=A0A2G8KS61_STIJA|nr:putative myosin-9-like [Apostichopus japonicus]